MATDLNVLNYVQPARGRSRIPMRAVRVQIWSPSLLPHCFLAFGAFSTMKRHFFSIPYMARILVFCIFFV